MSSTTATELDPLDAPQPPPAAAEAGDGDDDAGGKPSGPTTTFDFQHKVFAAPNAVFVASRSNGEPVFSVNLGDMTGQMTLATLRRSFGIEPGTPDARLLTIVEKSLKFVREIRPGDNIPRELLDGTASWRVEPRHVRIAEGRLSVQLVAWMAGEEARPVDRAQLESITEDPDLKRRVQDAFSELAKKFNLPEERKGEIINKVSALARELAYIESLRDRVFKVLHISVEVGRAQRIFKSDRAILDDLSRMQMLMRKPVSAFTERLQQVDAQTGDVMALLKSFDGSVAAIRAARDKLHTGLMIWDEPIALWDEVELDRTPECELLLKQTYQFLARHFLVSQVWQRSGA